MAEAKLRARKSSSVKPKSKAMPSRKPKTASATTDKAFMLKDKKPEPTPQLAEPRVRPKAKTKAAPARKRAAAKPKAIIAAKAIMPDKIEAKIAPARNGQAVVVWKKNRATDNLAFWLRSTGRSMMQRLRYGRAVLPPTQAPIGAKLRTKNDLLREIAALRQENAMMRDRLGLPRAAFGRQVAEAL